MASSMPDERPEQPDEERAEVVSGIRIDNPLKSMSSRSLRLRSRKFARKVNKENPDYKLFLKAARIARSPRSWEGVVPDITQQEKSALKEEQTRGFWAQPKPLRVAVVTLCFSAMVQGFIQTGINGGNLTWPLYFGLTTGSGAFENWNHLWWFVGVNSITYFAAALAGCWLSDPLQSHRYGRRDAILVSAVVCLISFLGCACSRSVLELLIWRIFVGIGMGVKAATTPIFGAEISPSHLRGALVMNWQQFDTVGILGGFTANIVVSYIGSVPLKDWWRWQIASAVLPTICLLTLAWTIPESPRWLLKKDRYPEAFASMRALRETPLQAAIEMFYADAQLQREAEVYHHDRNAARNTAENAVDSYPFQRAVKNTSYTTRISQLFAHPRTRRATIAACVVMLAQQLCGMNVLAFYSATIFQSTNPDQSTDPEKNTLSNHKWLWLSWAVGMVNCLFTVPAYYLIDKRGRRYLLLVTYPFMIVFMLGACLSFLHGDKDQRTSLVGVFLFLFVIAYSLGQGPVAFTYASEAFPLMYREAGMSLAVFSNLFGAGILTMFAPLAQATNNASADTVGLNYQQRQSILLAVLVILLILALVLIFFFVFETIGAHRERGTGRQYHMSLEELDYIFASKFAKHKSYQVHQVLPYMWKTMKWRVRLGPKPGPLPELYNYDDGSEDDGDTGGSDSDDGSDGHESDSGSSRDRGQSTGGGIGDGAGGDISMTRIRSRKGSGQGQHIEVVQVNNHTRGSSVVVENATEPLPQVRLTSPIGSLSERPYRK